MRTQSAPAMLAVTVILVAILPSSSSAAADGPGSSARVRSWAWLDPYRGDGLVDVGARVEASPGAGPVAVPRMCVSARMPTVRTATSIVRREEITCGSVRFEFDPVRWSAAAGGRLPSTVSTERWKRTADGWERSVRTRGSTVQVDLSWRGVGEPHHRVESYLPSPVTCLGSYWPFFCMIPMASTGLDRAAVVSGTIRFNGLERTTRLQRRDIGEMGWRAP